MNDVTNWSELPIGLSAKQVSNILNISLPKAYELFHREDFPSIKISKKRLLVEKNQFKKWIDTQSAVSCDKVK